MSDFQEAYPENTSLQEFLEYTPCDDVGEQLLADEDWFQKFPTSVLLAHCAESFSFIRNGLHQEHLQAREEPAQHNMEPEPECDFELEPEPEPMLTHDFEPEAQTEPMVNTALASALPSPQFARWDDHSDDSDDEQHALSTALDLGPVVSRAEVLAESQQLNENVGAGSELGDLAVSDASEAAISQVCELGFSREDAASALVASKQSVERAIDLLLNQAV